MSTLIYIANDECMTYLCGRKCYTNPEIFEEILKYSCTERTFSVQNVEDGVHGDASIISILLNLLLTMVWLTILKTLPSWSN